MYCVRQNYKRKCDVHLDLNERNISSIFILEKNNKNFNLHIKFTQELKTNTVCNQYHQSHRNELFCKMKKKNIFLYKK